jgi:hypothetical protein
MRLTKCCGFQSVLARLSTGVDILQSRVFCAVSVVNCQMVTEQSVCYQYNATYMGHRQFHFVKIFLLPKHRMKATYVTNTSEIDVTG